jgi:NADH-quinone oxidoreductase subunit M
MVATIIACTSIVVTAVYILRVVGKILYGEVENKHFLELTDASWDERVAVCCLIFCVAGLGCAPFFFSDMISPSVGNILSSIGVM